MIDLLHTLRQPQILLRAEFFLIVVRTSVPPRLNVVLTFALLVFVTYLLLCDYLPDHPGLTMPCIPWLLARSRVRSVCSLDLRRYLFPLIVTLLTFALIWHAKTGDLGAILLPTDTSF